MAPEALLKQPHNEKVDVYSYGIVCWQILAMHPQPYQEYLELGSLETFIDGICRKQERPSLGDIPKSVKTIVRKLWDHEPNTRPDFESVIDELNNVTLSCALIYEDARKFWKKHFEGKYEVKFDSFAKHLFEDLHINLDKEGTKYKCLEQMMCNHDDTSNLIDLDRFGLILKWFGPLIPKDSNLIANIENIMENKFFHGSVSRQEIAEYSGQFQREKRKKQFLVRFSETEPIEDHPFSITQWNGEKSTSYRINYDSAKGEYSCSYKDKKDQMTETSDSLLSQLIKKMAKNNPHLGLKSEIPSKYTSIFKKEIADQSYSNENLVSKN